MKVYDFDKTIFKGNSSFKFCMFCLKKNIKILPDLLKFIPSAGLYFLRKISIEEFKSSLYAFLPKMDNMDDLLVLFWDKYEKDIYPWYLKQKDLDDLIISASPYFLLKPIAKRLGVNLIASFVDQNTGKLLGKNNSKEEKLINYKKIYGRKKIDEFYSDSLDDLAMAKNAKKAFIVRRGSIRAWEITK